MSSAGKYLNHHSLGLFIIVNINTNTISIFLFLYYLFYIFIHIFYMDNWKINNSQHHEQSYMYIFHYKCIKIRSKSKIEVRDLLIPRIK